MGASEGRFWKDLELILVTILDSRAHGAILAKTSTALTREHDFQGSEGPKNESKMAPKPASRGNLAPRASWEPLGLDVGAVWGPF